MINIDFIQKDRSYLNNSYNSMIIIGPGDTEFQSNKIVYPESLNEVEDTFGIDSPLTQAYKEAKTAGAENVFLCNCYKFTDYVDSIDLICQNDFSLVVPLFDFSTTFTSPITKKETYLAEVYSEFLEDSLSTLIITDKHASLYEDMDHYLNTMRSINYKFRSLTYGRLLNGENICFVLNNLKDYKYSNVALAAILSESSLRYYPSKDIGEVVYDVNSEDLFDHEISYFAYDDLSKTTIENLQNYYETPSPEKMLLISIIKNRIKSKLDYESFTGRLINKYTKIELENYTKEVLQTFIGTLIENFKVIDIVYEQENPGEVNINIYMDIKPYSSIEKIEMKVEV